MNREKGVAPPPVRSPRIATRNLVPFHPTLWVGVRTHRFAQHFGPAGHSVVRRAGALAFIALATLRWDTCVGLATIQTTNDAYVPAELIRLARQPTTPFIRKKHPVTDQLESGSGRGA